MSTDLILQSSNLPECIVSLIPGGDDPTPASTPGFFCAPGAGGGVHKLATLANVTELQRPFYGLETRVLPESLRSPFSIQGSAKYFLAAIRQIQPKGPYFLGGYSLGGLIAIEMAHELFDMGEPVYPVILIDTYAGLPAGLLWSLIQRAKTAPDLGEWKAFLANRLSRRLRQLRNSPPISPDFDDDESVVRDEMEVALDYIRRDLSSCRVPLRIIFSRAPSRLAPRGADRGWARISKTDFQVHEITGDHHSILKRPHVSELSALLKAFVDG